MNISDEDTIGVVQVAECIRLQSKSRIDRLDAAGYYFAAGIAESSFVRSFVRRESGLTVARVAPDNALACIAVPLAIHPLRYPATITSDNGPGRSAEERESFIRVHLPAAFPPYARTRLMISVAWKPATSVALPPTLAHSWRTSPRVCSGGKIGGVACLKIEIARCIALEIGCFLPLIMGRKWNR